MITLSKCGKCDKYVPYSLKSWGTLELLFKKKSSKMGSCFSHWINITAFPHEDTNSYIIGFVDEVTITSKFSVSNSLRCYSKYCTEKLVQ